MDLYANPTITDFQQDVNGDIKMLKIGVKKEDAYANIIGQASADLENNKAATINVSTYTQPVEVTPTAGKDGMKKATITLTNIPSPSGTTTLYAWNNEDDTVYTLTETPSVGQYALYGQSGTDSFNQCALVEIVNVAQNYIYVEYNNVSSMQMSRNNSRDISLT